jgi:hypothetical protein
MITMIEISVRDRRTCADLVEDVCIVWLAKLIDYISVSQPLGPGINYTRPSSYKKKEITRPQSDRV